MEFDLAFLIRSCGISQPNPDRRLNGIENMIAALARQWRGGFQPLRAAEELRMAPETLAQLRGWVEGAEAATGRTATRLATYMATLDDVMATGWVRLLLT